MPVRLAAGILSFIVVIIAAQSLAIQHYRNKAIVLAVAIEAQNNAIANYKIMLKEEQEKVKQFNQEEDAFREQEIVAVGKDVKAIPKTCKGAFQFGAKEGTRLNALY